MGIETTRSQASTELKAEFAKRLAERMLAADMNQSELARRVKMSKDAVSTYTRGRSLPSPASLAKIAQVLGCQPGELLPRRYDTAPQVGPTHLLIVNEFEAEIRIQRVVRIETAMKIVEMLRQEDVHYKAAPEAKPERATKRAR